MELAGLAGVLDADAAGVAGGGGVSAAGDGHAGVHLEGPAVDAAARAGAAAPLRISAARLRTAGMRDGTGAAVAGGPALRAGLVLPAVSRRVGCRGDRVAGGVLAHAAGADARGDRLRPPAREAPGRLPPRARVDDAAGRRPDVRAAVDPVRQIHRVP